MTWEPRHDDPLLLLAMDHRDSLAALLAGALHADPVDPRTGEPDAAVEAAVRSAKQLIFEGLRQAAPQLTAGRAGVLVDEQYGRAVIDEVRADPGGIVLAVPIEASGQEYFSTQYGGRWTEHVEELQPAYAKVLVRDNPEFPVGAREQQFDLLADAADELAKIGVPLLYELLVPATQAQLAGVGGDAYRYDCDVRPALVAQVIADNQEHGISPRLWKLEGFETEADATAIAGQARDAGLIVLGRDAPAERLQHWLAVASRVPAFAGFAIGRSIWQDVLLDHLRHGDDEAARKEIATRYLDLAALWRP